MNAQTPNTPVTAIPVDDLTWICTSLCELLEIENAALERHDVTTVRELTENKSALAKLYEKTLMSIGENGATPTLPREDFERLATLGTRLADLMDRNAMMLKAEMEARQKVMDVFVTAAKAHTKPTISYGKFGTYDEGKPERASTSLTYNKTL